MSKLSSCLVPFLVVALAACGDNQRAPVAPDASDVLDAGVADARIPDAAARDAVTLACTIEDLQPLFTCATTNCLNFTPDFDGGLGGDGGLGFDPTQILSCVAQRCGLLVFGLPPACRTCVLSGLAGLAGGSFDGVLANCVSQPPPPIP